MISAGQSWLYFDSDVVAPKVHRALKDDGRLVLTHLVWLPFRDGIARESERLVLKYNPDWKGAHFKGTGLIVPDWSRELFDVCSFHVVNRPIPFTRESWRGRIRACRGIGASLTEAQVKHFDEEHDRLLRDRADDTFTVLHQIGVLAFLNKGQLVSG